MTRLRVRLRYDNATLQLQNLELEVDKLLIATTEENDGDKEEGIEDVAEPAAAEELVPILQAVFLVALEPLDDNHDADGQHLPLAEYLVDAREGFGVEHLVEITDGAGNAGGTEDDPSDDSQQEGQGHLPQLLHCGQHSVGSHRIGVFAVLA